MKYVAKIVLLGALLFSANSMASVNIPIGSIKQISYRGGYITLKIVGDDGTNYCEPCPVDPGKRSTKKCWIQETKTAQISMLLSAQARGKKIYGRVGDFSTVCEIYQMSIED
ncbi:MAG: hypothetical protein GY820_25530 [Gammaproteobacteria bacterium]|nr:hypothetical protein [Gammaproteobacteria bacterium]